MGELFHSYPGTSCQTLEVDVPSQLRLDRDNVH